MYHHRKTLIFIKLFAFLISVSVAEMLWVSKWFVYFPTHFFLVKSQRHDLTKKTHHSTQHTFILEKSEKLSNTSLYVVYCNCIKQSNGNGNKQMFLHYLCLLLLIILCKGRLSYHLCFECFSQLSFDSEVYKKSAAVADFVYTSESNESCEKHSTQRW